MRKNELIHLRKLVMQEVKRRERIKELLENEAVLEYLNLTNTKIEELDSTQIRDILKQILSSFTITKTHGIFVCTSAYYIDWEINYEETFNYSKYVDVDSIYAENKIYTDIESGEVIGAVKDHKDYDIRPLIDTFENEHIVLNPHNTSNHKNGYEDVRMDFFETSFYHGQEKGKQFVLSKYPRI